MWHPNLVLSLHQGAKGSVAGDSPAQQQGTWSATPQNQAIQRKVAMTGQQQQGTGRALQAGRGGMGNKQQNRVCHKWGFTFFRALDTETFPQKMHIKSAHCLKMQFKNKSWNVCKIVLSHWCYPGIQLTHHTSNSGNKAGQCARCKSIDKLKTV